MPKHRQMIDFIKNVFPVCLQHYLFTRTYRPHRIALPHAHLNCRLTHEILLRLHTAPDTEKATGGVGNVPRQAKRGVPFKPASER